MPWGVYCRDSTLQASFDYQVSAIFIGLMMLQRYPTFTQSGVKPYPTAIAFRELSGESSPSDEGV